MDHWLSDQWLSYVVKAQIILRMFLIGLLPGIVGLLIFRRRAGVRPRHAPLFVLPLLVWDFLSTRFGPGGSLTNAFAEPLWLGVSMSALLIVLIVYRSLKNPAGSGTFWAFLLLSCVVAVGFALFFPDLPE